VLLYDNELSGNCYKVRLLFAQLGIDYAREEVNVFDRADREKVLGRMNPGLRIPTVVLDDGRALAESNAILYYFAQGSPYLPEDAFQRAMVLQWQFFEQYSHEPNIAVARFWAHAGITPSPEVLEEKLRGGHAALKALDRHLAEREFVVDDHYTVADISLYAYTHVAPEGGFGLEGYPAVRAWLQRVAAQPGHVPIRAG
jgi:glutathione S-transferase